MTEQTNWQPIKTAPRIEGQHFLMFGHGADFAECIFIGMLWHGTWADAFSMAAVDPTYWATLPNLPIDGEPKDGNQ